jgi:Xaa-Pro aminopeptidase
MKYISISPEMYQYNRQRFAAQMQPGTVAIFNSNDMMPRTGRISIIFSARMQVFCTCQA